MISESQDGNGKTDASQQVSKSSLVFGPVNSNMTTVPVQVIIPAEEGASQVKPATAAQGLTPERLAVSIGLWSDTSVPCERPMCGCDYECEREERAHIAKFTKAAEKIIEMLAEAHSSGIEEAASDIDCTCPERAATLKVLGEKGPAWHFWPCERGQECCALRAAKVRSLKKPPSASARVLPKKGENDA